MTRMARRFLPVAVVLALAAIGCTTGPKSMSLSGEKVRAEPERAQGTAAPEAKAALPATDTPIKTVAYREPSRERDGEKPELLPVPKTATESLPEPHRIRPCYAELETLPIDLPTVIRLIDARSPTAELARARVREAEARLAQANVAWVPNLSVGAAYNRFDGQTQNQRGEVFAVSRQNLFFSGGPALTLDLAEAIYRPLIARRAAAAEVFRSAAARNAAELDAVSAYLDLVQVHALHEINAETLRRATEMLTAAQNATEARLDRSAGDVNRARIEVLTRQAERIDLEGRIGTVSARLGKLLLLPPNLRLVPADAHVVAITLIDPHATLDDLIRLALERRPDLAANRQAIAGAWERVRADRQSPFLPKLLLTDQGGTFGGGKNSNLDRYRGRNVLSVQLYWEIKNLGLSYHALGAERMAAVEQAHVQFVETQARLVAEIVEAAQIAAARFEALDSAEKAVREATELYRINKEGTKNVVDVKNLFDALRPLQAIQLLNQTRAAYLNAVIDYTRAQYRLFVLIGATPHALPVAPTPPPHQPKPEAAKTEPPALETLPEPRPDR